MLVKNYMGTYIFSFIINRTYCQILKYYLVLKKPSLDELMCLEKEKFKSMYEEIEAKTIIQKLMDELQEETLARGARS